MSQHDMTLDNASGLSFRTDANNALQALASQCSGAAAPSPSFPCQMWADTGTGRLRERNAANTAWLDKGALDVGLPTQLVTQDMTAFTSAGTAPAFTLTPVPAISAYAAPQRFHVKFHAPGSGSNTLNVSGVGAKSLKQYDSSGVKIPAVITLGLATDVVYDGTDMVILDPLPAVSGDAWLYMPIGVPIPVFDHIAGVSIPSTSSAFYRYIKLTAADAFNTGVLVSESVTGSVPLVLATAVVSLSGSPINGQTVELMNTSKRMLRAGPSGTLEDDQFQGHRFPLTITSNAPVGAGSYGGNGGAAVLTTGDAVTDGTNGTPRKGIETRSKNIGATFYMRIK